jgi:hypothetical protein
MELLRQPGAAGRKAETRQDFFPLWSVH